jgi:hypothetical protein
MGETGGAGGRGTGKDKDWFACNVVTKLKRVTTALAKVPKDACPPRGQSHPQLKSRSCRDLCGAN